MKKTLISVFLISLASAIVLLAQTREPRKPENARFGNPTNTGRNFQDLYYGVVKALGKNEMVQEKTKFGVDQAIKLDAKTKFYHDENPSTFENLKTGDQVWIQVKTEKKTGEMLAKRVYTGVIAPTVQK